ncbi:MAG: hypothetical protein A2Y61_04375 [Chloroflexi bacterium RBG_13_60_13]|nr:MAG: hypothetical protein A2Y61_04375 [Chloroflexi bacterium RBG_13_60_13]
MNRKLVPLAAALVAGALALLVVTVAQADKSDIFGSGHDLGTPAVPTCTQCHVPHNAQGDYLWARGPGEGAGLLTLCLSCHDGSITPVGEFIPDPSYATHFTRPGIPGFDCDICHNPHEGDNWMFVGDNIPVSYRNANICDLCHDTAPPDFFTHPTNVLTNLPADRTWDPYATPEPDFSGTQLWNSGGTAVVPAGDAYIKCKTCHVPHGALRNAGADQMLNSMALYELDPGPDGTPGTDDDKHLQPICTNCHD